MPHLLVVTRLARLTNATVAIITTRAVQRGRLPSLLLKVQFMGEGTGISRLRRPISVWYSLRHVQ